MRNIENEKRELSSVYIRYKKTTNNKFSYFVCFFVYIIIFSYLYMRYNFSLSFFLLIFKNEHGKTRKIEKESIYDIYFLIYRLI